jgi:two-component system OmpR family response regulator
MNTRILVVEDNATLGQVLRDNLLFEGFQVRWASNARMAMAAARDFAPDLVLLDIMLPDGNGFDLCPLLRRGGGTSVILLSARSQKVDKLRGFAAGADDYVTKPFGLDDLLGRIRVALRRARPAIEHTPPPLAAC